LNLLDEDPKKKKEKQEAAVEEYFEALKTDELFKSLVDKLYREQNGGQTLSDETLVMVLIGKLRNLLSH